jgi:transcriptional regulator with GAF, ATPase, and Fis domain
LLAWLSVGSITDASDTRNQEPKRVLVIYSYHEGVPWERLINDSLCATLASKATEPIELNVEHADRIRYPGDAYLQDGEFERLGSSITIKVDVRVIAATNRDLEKRVREGRFREDLYYRLNVFPITVPPLREHSEDIPLLTRFFVEKAGKRLGRTIKFIPENVMRRLQEYPWPGNVPELQNVIERAVINSAEDKLRLADDLRRADSKRDGEPIKSLQESERDHIIRALEKTNWRIAGPKGAAVILKLNPNTLRSRIRKLGIKKS